MMRRLAVLAALLTVLAAREAVAARITFVLVNDIYLMNEQVGPDGKARGGFARLAAVVKAERARGAVIFAHAGDTLSPSLMSGFDRGAHIIALTNMIKPDIFAPGNHEFDFGKATFLQRMAEANFPLYADNLRGPDGAVLPGFKDSAIVTVEGIKLGLVGATYDDSARASSPEDLKFTPTVETTTAQAEALRRDGADFVVAVVHASRPQDYRMFATRTIDLILTGHDHDLFVEYDGRNAMIESSYDAHYVTAIDVEITVKEENGRRTVTWWPQFRIIDTATVTPDPEVAAAVAAFEKELSGELDVPLATTDVELDSRSATVRSREAAVGDLIADAMRISTNDQVAVMNGGGIRGGKIYPPGSKITRRDILAELPFDNRTLELDVMGRDLRAALENGFSLLPQTSGRFPQVSGMTIEVDTSRPAGSRIVSIKVGDAPLDDDRTYSVATNDFLARGGDGYVQFRDARRVLQINDAPLLANDVMVYLRRLGTVTSIPGGRIILK